MDKQHHKTTLENVILEIERQTLNSYLEKIFGYYLLQIGGHPDVIATKNSSITHKIYFNSEIKVGSCDSIVQGNFDALPFLADSIDLVVIPHLLETVDNLKGILEEVHRVLLPEGHVIIMGFNPFSLLGIVEKFRLTIPKGCHLETPQQRGKTKDEGHDYFKNKRNLISVGHVSAWLDYLGFDLVDSKTFFFRLPVSNNVILKKTLFMEIVGQMLLPMCGGIYILMAKKRVVTLTPIKGYFLKRRLNIAERYPSLT